MVKKGKRYCIDKKLNRQVRRDRMRVKTGILIFLSVFLATAIFILTLIVGAVLGIHQPQ
jgi:hypothetical protein